MDIKAGGLGLMQTFSIINTCVKDKKAKNLAKFINKKFGKHSQAIGRDEAVKVNKKYLEYIRKQAKAQF
jgi:hypothetical protein